MEMLQLSKSNQVLRAEVALEGSKSLSNRALIILALAGVNSAQWLDNLSSAEDTRILQGLLEAPAETCDAGDAGTAFRFLTAYLALQPGVQILTGSNRMQERPIGELVHALRTLGANIEFVNTAGYPPLRIGAPEQIGKQTNTVRIKANVSSQFLSALLLIGPCLPNGLELIPEGELISRPYLEMTLKMMQFFGAKTTWQSNRIVVNPGGYRPRKLSIEADWSAASYWYALAALADKAELLLHGLSMNSWQGDAVLIKMMEAFGLKTRLNLGNKKPGVFIQTTNVPPTTIFEYDFRDCPDLAQTLAVVCAGLGVSGNFSGLETLKIKETDRIAALQKELEKVGVHFDQGTIAQKKPAIYQLSGEGKWDTRPRFATYGDHRMAMAFAPLAMLGPVQIEHPEVVQKSYPSFWKHLATAGFVVEKWNQE